MEYKDVTSFINKAKKFGSRLDLTRIKKLCSLLGNPQDKCEYVHIAGTNGKGSTSIFIENILVSAGYKTGLFTSPFIYEFNERIQINNVPISDCSLISVMEQVVYATDKMLSEGYEHPTEFELITAAAFLYFAEEQCDVVVLEVGLGGILDSTNIIKKPLVSVITSISYDHMDYLGNTISEIAKNKCGIIKTGCHVVSYPVQKKEVLDIIKQTAGERMCHLTISDLESLEIEEISLVGNKFSYNDERFVIGLVGEYQIYNAITAINAVYALICQGYVISHGNIKKGLEVAKWPARFEILCRTPIVIADGSHNANGMEAFVNTVKKCIDGRKIVCVFGMLKDKEYEKCLAQLSEITDTVIVTEVDSPRTENAENLANSARKYFSYVYEKADNSDALYTAKELCDNDGTIIALGSLYMMKNIKDSASKIFK